MGRTPWSSRLTIESCLCLSVVELHRTGVFEGQPGGCWRWKWPGAEGGSCALALDLTVVEVPGRALGVRLGYGTGCYSSMSQTVAVTTTRPHFGGRRYWFLCPMSRDGSRCGRRVGRLYLPPGRVFGCRKCHDLIHSSARTHDSRKDMLRRDPSALAAALLSPKRRRLALAVLMDASRQ